MFSFIFWLGIVCSLKQFFMLGEGSRPPCILLRGNCASPAQRDRRGSCQIISMPKLKSSQMGFLCSVFGGEVAEVDLVARRCVFQRWKPPLWPLSKLSLTMKALLQVVFSLYVMQNSAFHHTFCLNSCLNSIELEAAESKLVVVDFCAEWWVEFLQCFSYNCSSRSKLHQR